MSIILYGAPVSYFTGKARAYLDWSGLAYKEELATMQVYQSVILPRVGWPVIPVVVGPEDETLQDTSDIIDALGTDKDVPSVYPEGPRQRLVALLFELLGDEWLVVPAMHYRWAYNQEFAHGEFGSLADPNAPLETRIQMGKALAAPFENMLTGLGIQPQTVPAIEASYLTLLDQLDAHFAIHPMLLGTRPSIGDFGLYGPLFAHLYRDPASGRIMKERAPHVAAWVERLTTLTPRSGDFLPDDVVPATLLPILRDQLRDFLPILVGSAERLRSWAADKERGAPVPRGLGRQSFRIGNAEGERAVIPYNLWMLQRVLDCLDALDSAQRESCESMLSSFGAEALTRWPTTPRLTRQNFKLALG